jgi:hypothetical protein
MVKMDDVRKVGKGGMSFSMDGTGPETILNLEAAELKRFEEPTKEDVFKSLRHELEKREPNGEMVVNLESGRLIAFRIESGNQEAEWDRVPPIDGWKHRDKDKGYYYFFAMESGEGMGQLLQKSVEFDDIEYLNEIYEPLGDDYCLLVQTPKLVGEDRFDESDFERGFRVLRSGFNKKGEMEIFEKLFSNQMVGAGGNFYIDPFINVDQKHIQVYFNWPDIAKGESSGLKTLKSLKNRIGLMAIGGDFVPENYKSTREKWVDLIKSGKEYVRELTNESRFSLGANIAEIMTRAFDPNLIQKMFVSDPKMNYDPSLNLEIKDSTLNMTLSDTSAMIYRGMRTGGGKYQLGNWHFELVISRIEDDDMFEVQGLSVTNVAVKGVELMLTYTQPEIITNIGISMMIQQIEGLKVNKAILRKSVGNSGNADMEKER